MRRYQWNYILVFLLLLLVLYTTWSLVDLEIANVDRIRAYDRNHGDHLRATQDGPPSPLKAADSREDPDFYTVKRFITLYNISAPSTADFKCVNIRINPPTPICIYDEWSDMYISHDLQETGLWEPHVLTDFQDALRRDRTLGLIDVGANIGMYTLIAANMGHDVVAIEPFEDSIYRLHKSAILSKTQERILVLKNAVADRRTLAFLRTSGNNQGDTRVVLDAQPCIGSCPKVVKTILLDDLRFVLTFSRAILKIDSQGYEHVAFQHASKLFEQVFIPYIYMEWIVMRDHYVRPNHTSTDKDLVENLLGFLYDRDYRPYRLDAEGATVLHRRAWQTWPNDVVWRRLPVQDEYSKLLRNHFLNWPL